jgi:hypothetical protein
MASLADLLASVDTGNMTGASLPMQQVPQQRQRGNFLSTLGNIADAVAMIGGAEPGYRSAMKQRQMDEQAQAEREAKAARQAQFQNSLATYLANPQDKGAFVQLAQADPETALEYRKAMMPPVAREASQPREILIARMLEDPNTSPQMKARLEQMIAPAPKPVYRSTPGGGTAMIAPDGTIQEVIPGRAPAPRGRGGAAPAGAPRPFGPQDYVDYNIDPSVPMVFDRYGQAKPVGGASTVGEGARGGLSAADFGKAKARLAKIPTLESALARLETATAALDDSLLTGVVGGRLPQGLSENADKFENALGAVRTTIRTLTRTAGEGSISDYETALNEALFPARTGTPEGRLQAVANLRTLAADLKREYQMMTQGGLSPRRAPPAAGGFRVLRSRPAQ